MARVEGYLDGVRFRTVQGWACDTSRTENRLLVCVGVNGASAGIALADQFRADLAQAGYGDGKYGFQFPVPEKFETVERVEVVVAETGLALPLASESPVCKDSNRRLPEQWRCFSGFRMPSFFLLGAAKSGTTSLHVYLGQHPAICMSNPKEPFFFEAEYELGPTFYFNRYFSHWDGEPVVGESRHRNLYLPYIPQRINEFNPSARFVVILRNPVERAISHWWHWYSRNLESLPLHEALLVDLNRVRSGYRLEEANEREIYTRTLAEQGKGCYRTYIDTGYYADQLSRYISMFGRDRLCVVRFEEFVRDPEQVVCKVFEFLGVDSSHAASVEYRVVNKSQPGMLEHVDDAVLSMLAQHYRRCNDDLGRLLGQSFDEWAKPFENTN